MAKVEPERDEKDLGHLADAKPDDGERHESQDRHGARRLHDGVQQIFTDAKEPREHGQHHADGDPEAETFGHATQRDQQVGQENALLGELSTGVEDGEGRRHFVAGEDARRADHLPQDDDREWTDDASNESRHTKATLAPTSTSVGWGENDR